MGGSEIDFGPGDYPPTEYLVEHIVERVTPYALKNLVDTPIDLLIPVRATVRLGLLAWLPRSKKVHYLRAWHVFTHSDRNCTTHVYFVENGIFYRQVDPDVGEFLTPDKLQLLPRDMLRMFERAVMTTVRYHRDMPAVT